MGINWTNALGYRDSVSLWRRPLNVLFPSAAVQIWLWPTKIKKEAERKNTQCQPLCCTKCKIYTCTLCTQTHAHHPLTYTISSYHPFTDPHRKLQRKPPLRKWFTLKSWTWPTSIMFKGRINAYGYSSDSLSGWAIHYMLYLHFRTIVLSHTIKREYHLFSFWMFSVSLKNGCCHQPYIRERFKIMLLHCLFLA